MKALFFHLKSNFISLLWIRLSFLFQNKLLELERMASYRKAKLNDNSAFLQFNWKADVVESWIGMYKFCVTFMVTVILGGGVGSWS